MGPKPTGDPFPTCRNQPQPPALGYRPGRKLQGKPSLAGLEPGLLGPYPSPIFTPKIRLMTLDPKSESPRSHRLGPLAVLLIGLTGAAAAQSIPPGALPSGASILGGQADGTSVGNHMIIRQTSPRAAIRWNDFNVGSAASIEFLQPNAHSSILNQVSGRNPSHILGRIRANGNASSLPTAMGSFSGTRLRSTGRHRREHDELGRGRLHEGQAELQGLGK